MAQKALDYSLAFGDKGLIMHQQIQLFKVHRNNKEYKIGQPYLEQALENARSMNDLENMLLDKHLNEPAECAPKITDLLNKVKSRLEN